MRIAVGGLPPSRQPIVTVAQVDELVMEIMARILHGDLEQERMNEFVPLLQQAQRVRELVPFQRDWLEACEQLFKADGPEEIAAADRAFEKACEGLL